MIYARWLEIIVPLVSFLVLLACLRIRLVFRVTSGIFALLLFLLGFGLCISDAESRQMVFKNNYAGDGGTATLSHHLMPFDNVNTVNDGCCSYPGIEEGDTLLIMASRHGYRENVRFLLARGADRNIRNKRGDTALDAARRNRHTEICRMLEAP